MEASVECHDLEAGRFDRTDGVAGGPAAAERARPEECVDRVLNPSKRSVFGADVLVEAQLASGGEHAT